MLPRLALEVEAAARAHSSFSETPGGLGPRPPRRPYTRAPSSLIAFTVLTLMVLPFIKHSGTKIMCIILISLLWTKNPHQVPVHFDTVQDLFVLIVTIKYSVLIV